VHPLVSSSELGYRHAYREVGNTTTDEQNTAFGMLGHAQHQVEDGTGIQVRLALAGRTGVFTVVCKFAGETRRCDGVGVHDRGTTSSNQSPDAASGVEDSQLERCTSLSIQRGDVSKPDD
jgi:hypothetical protein